MPYGIRTDRKTLVFEVQRLFSIWIIFKTLTANFRRIFISRLFIEGSVIILTKGYIQVPMMAFHHPVTANCSGDFFCIH